MAELRRTACAAIFQQLHGLGRDSNGVKVKQKTLLASLSGFLRFDPKQSDMD